MTALIISDNGDGTATVAPIDATPEMLQEGEQFASMDEALQAADEVLAPQGDDTQPGEGEAPLDAEVPVNEPPMENPDLDEEEQEMGGGYKMARRGH